QNVKTVLRIAGTTAIAAVATLAGAAAANSAEVGVPYTNYSFNVQGVEHVTNIKQDQNTHKDGPSLSIQVSSSTTAAKANYSASAPANPAASSTGQKVVDAVYSKIGAPCAWGATGPSSFDCAGLTSWAYAQAGKQIPRPSQAQASGGTPVAISDLQ